MRWSEMNIFNRFSMQLMQLMQLPLRRMVGMIWKTYKLYWMKEKNDLRNTGNLFGIFEYNLLTFLGIFLWYLKEMSSFIIGSFLCVFWAFHFDIFWAFSFSFLEYKTRRKKENSKKKMKIHDTIDANINVLVRKKE